VKLYDFWGIARSGNHAVIHWAIKNFIDNTNKIMLEDHSYFSDKLLYINCFIKDYEPHKIVLRQGLKLKPNFLFISYENRYFDQELRLSFLPQRFIIVRNLENLAASRIKKGWGMDRNLFNIWEHYIKSPWPKIHYDRWLVDKCYRDSVASQMGVINKDITDEPTKEGRGSSFVGLNYLDSKENLLTRYQQIEIPESTKNLILEYGKRNPEYCNIDGI
jgi:hypothetical protein